MATKKKTITTPSYLGSPPEMSTVFVGSNSSIPQSVSNQIPNFDNSGVKFQGWYKVDKGNGLFEIRKQTTRFIVNAIGSGAFGSNLFARPNPTRKFFCTKIIIEMHGISTHSLSLGQMRISDVTGTSANTRLYFFPITADETRVYDLSDCPRLFSGDSIDIYTQASLGAQEFVIVSLFGWDED